MTAGAWRMPPEWAPHDRTWMAWPSAGYTLGDTEDEGDNEAAPRAVAIGGDDEAAAPQLRIVMFGTDDHRHQQPRRYSFCR